MGTLMDATDMEPGTGGYCKQNLFSMGAPGEFYTETLHTIAINTRETEFGSIIEPIPITLKTCKPYQTAQPMGVYAFPQQMLSTYAPATRLPVPMDLKPSTPVCYPSTSKTITKETRNRKVPPKKKWIKEYLEEEPKSTSPAPLRVAPLPARRANGLVIRETSPLSVPAPVTAPALALTPAPALAAAYSPAAALATAHALIPSEPAPVSAMLIDFTHEHSSPRVHSNISHGHPQIPSPPSVSSNGSSGSSGSNGSAPRAGTREVHNKLEKNRRAHLKECFELLKRQLPPTTDDKKSSNLSILGSALRYINLLRRSERDCEHQMERLAREKIAARQRLAALKREVAAAIRARSISIDPVIEENGEDRINGQVLGIPISITPSPPQMARMEGSPPHTLNLSTKLRTLPIQITPTTSQVVRTPYGARHNTLTLTTLATADQLPSTQNGLHENGLTSSLHSAQIHLPISQVVGSGGLVVGGALQLVSAPGGLRVLHAPPINGLSNGDNNRIPRENGLSSTNSTASETNGNLMVNGLTPLVVSQPGAHLLHTHTLTHKMVETQVVKGSMTPLTVSAQYLSAATIVKPMVVVSTAATPPSTST